VTALEAALARGGPVDELIRGELDEVRRRASTTPRALAP
jgi:hypothetical protein